MKNILSILLTVLTTTSSFAAKPTEKLKNFKPGKYVLVEGMHEQCAVKDFGYYTGAKNTIMIGPHHLFKTVPESDSQPSDIPTEKGCTYESSDTVDTQKGETTLTMISTLRCKEGIKYVLTEKAILSEQKVILDVNKEVEGEEEDEDELDYQYRCVWKPKDAK